MRGGKRHFFLMGEMPRTKDQVGNNSVCWESGESSNLVQRFLNTVHERELKQSIYQVISLQTWKKVGAMQFCSAHDWMKLVLMPQCTKLHIFMCSLVSSKNSILGITYFFWKWERVSTSLKFSCLSLLINIQMEEKNDGTLGADVYLVISTHHGVPALMRKG